MGAIDLHPSAVVYDHSYYPRGSRTSASPNRGHPHHCCYNLTRLKFWPLTWFQFRTARAPNRRDSTRIKSWITTRIPSKFEGHQKSGKKTATWFKLLGLEKTPKNSLPSPRSAWALGTEDAASGTLFGSRRSLDPVTRERGTAKSIEKILWNAWHSWNMFIYHLLYNACINIVNKWKSLEGLCSNNI